MQIAMMTWMRIEPIETSICRLARFGYDSIEVSGEPDLIDTKDVSRLLSENGLACWGAVSIMVEGRDLIHPEESVRASTIRYLRDCVTMIKELDGTVLTVVPAQVGKTKPTGTADEEWAWAVEGLRDVYDHSEKEGVLLAIEPLNRFETYFLNRHDQALLLAEGVGPHCGVCLDCFHLNIEEADPYQAILNTGDKLFDLHATDNNRLACGQGSFDWVRVLETLQAAGYDGALTVEFVAPIDRTPASPHQFDTGMVDTAMPHAQLQFIEDHSSGVLPEALFDQLTEVSIETLRDAMEIAGAA